MKDKKTRKYIDELIRNRHVNQAHRLATLRRQGKAPDTILHSARIISIESKKCPAERQFQQGQTKINHMYLNR